MREGDEQQTGEKLSFITVQYEVYLLLTVKTSENMSIV